MDMQEFGGVKVLHTFRGDVVFKCFLLVTFATGSSEGIDAQTDGRCTKFDFRNPDSQTKINDSTI